MCKRIVAVVLATLAAVATVAALAPRTAAQSPFGDADAEAAPFNPQMAALMSMLIQPRHAKLGLAARERNWELAAYAHKELAQALSTVAKVQPKFRNLTVAEMIESMTAESMGAVETAIQAKDAKKLAEAYDNLTDGCNSCHAAVNHGFIVIKPPEASSFPNQEFKGP